MKPLLHPSFKLEGISFSSTKKLRQHANELIKKGSDYEVNVGTFILEWLNEEKFILVQTSGSTGKPKKITLLKENVCNSAIATANYFDLKEGSKALLCLSPEFIAGKMMLVRAMVSGWDLYLTEPSKQPLRNIRTTFDFAAMVPYQVYHSLTHIKKVKKLIIGGGAVSKRLENSFQKAPTRIFATYGMTETISHIAIRPLNGAERSAVYGALPKVSFRLDSRGCLQISAPEIHNDLVTTNDMAELVSPFAFKFLGRADNVINTGGVKINPETVEEKLSEHIPSPFFIASEKDEALGERVILIIEGSEEKKQKDPSKAFSALNEYERPKKILYVPQFIYTETGKIKRADVLKLKGL